MKTGTEAGWPRVAEAIGHRQQQGTQTVSWLRMRLSISRARPRLTRRSTVTRDSCPASFWRTLAGSDLGHPEANPAERAAELCAASVLEAVEGGHRVLDAEAGVRACKSSDPRTMR
jgi:hypothetical protein